MKEELTAVGLVLCAVFGFASLSGPQNSSDQSFRTAAELEQRLTDKPCFSHGLGHTWYGQDCEGAPRNCGDFAQ